MVLILQSSFLKKIISFTPKKLMDSSKLNAKSWSSTINLEKGIRTTYEWFLDHNESFKEIKY